MRNRIPIAILALIDWLIAFFALYVAVCVRFDASLSHIRDLARQLGPLWPRAALFASIVVACLLAFGLYSGRRRPQFTDVFMRVVGALVVAAGAMGASYYVLPGLHLWRGVAALAAFLAGLGAVASRLVTRRMTAV